MLQVMSNVDINTGGAVCVYLVSSCAHCSGRGGRHLSEMAAAATWKSSRLGAEAASIFRPM